MIVVLLGVLLFSWFISCLGQNPQNAQKPQKPERPVNPIEANKPLYIRLQLLRS